MKKQAETKLLNVAGIGHVEVATAKYGDWLELTSRGAKALREAGLERDELQNQLYDLIDNLELAQLQKDGLRPEPMDVPELVIRPASEVDAQAATEAEEGYNE